ncbi:MAG: fimbrial biogenesis outer membrane usher protein, partial [Hyphomicrobiaceae bacterium]|nr:fimbrial biogenesis outer membrane usher protein [Hyphomicrobiaceae bacterium]
VVLENRLLYDGAVDAYICPARATCTYEHGSGLKRDITRLVYDLPASHIRFQLGDTTAIGLPIQRSTETFGVSIEKSAQKLAPGQSRAASARASLRIDRPSEVDVIVNGITLQRLSLKPGTYNVRDLPLATGANTVDLAITDDTGARRVQSFTTFAGTDMLAPGALEWSASAGLQSYLRDNQRQYEDSDGAIGTLFARYGVSEAITAEAHIQGDRRGAMGGAGVVTETPWGVFTFGAAISYGDDANNGYGLGLGSGVIGSGAIGSGSLVSGFGGSGGRSLGYAADISWDLVNYRGLLSAQSESLRLAAEYRSPEFFRPGQLASLASGIYYPEYNYWLRLSGSYSIALDWSTSVTLSGRYQFGDDEIAKLTPFSVTGDRYGADISMSRPFSPTVTGSLLVGYSNESFLRNGLDGQRSNDADFRAAIRFHVRPDERSTVTASYDSLDGLAGLSGYRSGGEGIGRWDASVDVQNFETTERTAASGSVGYTANRAEVRVSHHADVLAATGRSTHGTAQQQQRSSVRVGSGIAFADGVIGIGPPIRGDAFALVHPHDSLAGKTIAAGSFESPRAFADGWGPGVVGDLPAYAPTSVAIDVADLPVGYSLGAGTFDVAAPYKGGYALMVGSSASVSVFGTLLNTDGTPIELASGFATPSAGGAEPIPVFTNAKGRFGAEGLSPGRWLVDVESDTGPVRYAIDIPKGADGLIRTGELRPIGNKP